MIITMIMVGIVHMIVMDTIHIRVTRVTDMTIIMRLLTIHTQRILPPYITSLSLLSFVLLLSFCEFCYSVDAVFVKIPNVP